MWKFLDILAHIWRSCKVWINSLLRCWIIFYLLLQHKSGFWKTPVVSITTFVFIESMLFGNIGIGLCPSLTVSTFNDRKFIFASFLVISVCRDSSSKLCLFVCIRDFEIALSDLIWCSQIPPLWLTAGGFFFEVIQSFPLSWRKFSLLLWSISLNAFNNTCYAPNKIVP